MSDAGSPRTNPGAPRRGAVPALVLALDRAGGGFGFLLSVLASTTIASTMFIVVADVLSRALFNTSLPGVADFVANAIVACVFVQLGSTIRNGRLISAEFLMGGWEARRPALAHGAKLIFAIVAALLLWRSVGWLWNDMQRALADGAFAGSFGAFTFPLWPFKAAIVLGAAVALVECLRLVLIHAVSLARLAGKRDPSGFAFMVQGDHGPIAIGLMAFAGLFFLVACGMPVAFALIGMSFLGIWLIRDNIAVPTNTLGLALTNAVRSFEFGVIPLFIMMGLLLERAGVGRDAFQVAVVLLRHFRGGLGIATVAANAVFAAITGSSVASAAVFSRIAAQPMVEAGHTRRFAVGVIAGSSVLGMLLPPSLLLIVYGLLAEVSIGALFIAAILPGIGLALAFALLNVLLSHFAPGFVGHVRGGVEVEKMPVGTMLARLGPVLFLIVLVMGGIYGGFFSPTEAGAVGAFGALLVVIFRRRLTLANTRDVVLQTGYISVGILLLMMAANLYARLLTLSTIPMQATQAIEALNLTLIGFVLLYVLIVILLGMILDSVSIMLIILPIAVPVVTAMGGDLIWFGIVTVIAVEIGLLTPPFGLSVFVVKASLPSGFATLGEIFWGAAPFVLTMAVFTLLLIFFPPLALALL
jgi:tripartite ATP-independent transporter DctM subunit